MQSKGFWNPLFCLNHFPLKIIIKKKGLDKLQREKPSTAAIGNWGILQAVKRLSSASNDVSDLMKIAAKKCALK